ncbi:hypothetical protein [Vibrio astriarenae]|uniref:hypothetical protein n=1 Tax=Vibrio astriarenae TaxID=1481923 RepID=UPI0037355B01
MNSKLTLLTLAVAGALGLSGCDDDSTTTTASNTLQVQAIDGYLRNAQVWLDSEPDFLLNEELEPWAFTGDKGKAEIVVPENIDAESVRLIVQAISGETIDEDTITDNTPDGITVASGFMMSAPAGQAIVTPLSTLVDIKLAQMQQTDSDTSYKELMEKATEEVAEELGIDVVNVLGDYVEQGDKAALYAAQSIVDSNTILSLEPSKFSDMLDNIDSDQASEMLRQLDSVNHIIKQQVVATEPDELDDLDNPFTGIDLATDNDGDGVAAGLDWDDNNKDEWIDTDGDGIGDNADVFVNDKTEWLDTDNDQIGNNRDSDDDNDGVEDSLDGYPLDASLAGDPDADGIDTLNDAYPDDASKSVADTIRENQAVMAYLHFNHQQEMMLDIAVQEKTETLNSGMTRTTTTTHYLTLGGNEYGKTMSIDEQFESRFTRLSTFDFDFNLDGDAQFIGSTLDIGTRTETAENYLRYVDESDAALEGGSNGFGRTFDNVDLSARSHPENLAGIDVVQHLVTTISSDDDKYTYVTDFKEYDTASFVLDDEATYVSQYSSLNQTTIEDLLTTYIYDEQDWGADGNSNVFWELTVGEGQNYTLFHAYPVWANPQKVKHEEYADFNFTSGNWDNLTNYWYEIITEKAGGQTTYRGDRYVLSDEIPIKLTNEEAPTGLLFHSYMSVFKQLSDDVKTEYVTWAHQPLASYDFTTDSFDEGQSYRVINRLGNGIWITTSFDEWGSKNVTDLPSKVQDALSSGTALSDIDESMISGLSRYAAVLPNDSFQYSESAHPRQWYAVTQDSRLSDTLPSIVPVTLTEGGVLENSYIASVGPDLILIAPQDPENIWGWYNSYYRQMLQTYAMNTDETNFSWTTDIGQLFLSEVAAEERLAQIVDPVYRICSEQDTGETSGLEAKNFFDFVDAAHQCNYVPVDYEFVSGMMVSRPDEDENSSPITYQFNADGEGVYVETADDYTQPFSWYTTSIGTLTISFYEEQGWNEYFAIVADSDDSISVLAMPEWLEQGEPVSRIIGIELEKQ